jgi:glycosyltransferase involved in cell wall biosynthesis
MRLLFVHESFPAQFGRLALELTERYGWHCTCLFRRLSRCPSPSAAMLQRLELLQLPPDSDPAPPGGRPWAHHYGHALTVGRDVFETVRSHPEIRPDLVVGHGGLTPTLFLRDLVACPLVDYCEYYFAPRGRDLVYRVDLPPVEPAPFFPRCINAATLVNLVASDGGYTASDWQRCSFPQRFRHKIEVHFDGIDTDLYRPRSVPRRLAGRNLPAVTRVVTFVARGLESMRGFDLFMQMAQRIQAEHADVLFVVVGTEETYYGWDRLFTGQSSFKEWVLKQANYDVNRFLFLGHLEPTELADVLCLSDLHVYLSVPFVVSWSLFNAMACGCTVLASDTAPVREVIEAGRTGRVEPLFDVERLAQTALRVLQDPAAHRPLGDAARALMEEKYSLDVSVPALKAYFERVAAANRTAGL